VDLASGSSGDVQALSRRVVAEHLPSVVFAALLTGFKSERALVGPDETHSPTAAGA